MFIINIKTNMGNILYRKQKRQKSLDNGLTWIDTGEFRVGDVLENPSNCVSDDSKQCRWVELDVSEGYYCNGTNKYTLKVEECSENGIIWNRTGEVKQGLTFVESDSPDCGYVMYRWVDVGEVCMSDIFQIEVEELEHYLVGDGIGIHYVGIYDNHIYYFCHSPKDFLMYDIDIENRTFEKHRLIFNLYREGGFGVDFAECANEKENVIKGMDFYKKITSKGDVLFYLRPNRTTSGREQFLFSFNCDSKSFNTVDTFYLNSYHEGKSCYFLNNKNDDYFTYEVHESISSYEDIYTVYKYDNGSVYKLEEDRIDTSNNIDEDKYELLTYGLYKYSSVVVMENDEKIGNFNGYDYRGNIICTCDDEIYEDEYETFLLTKTGKRKILNYGSRVIANTADKTFIQDSGDRLYVLKYDGNDNSIEFLNIEKINSFDFGESICYGNYIYSLNSLHLTTLNGIIEINTNNSFIQDFNGLDYFGTAFYSTNGKRYILINPSSVVFKEGMLLMNIENYKITKYERTYYFAAYGDSLYQISKKSEYYNEDDTLEDRIVNIKTRIKYKETPYITIENENEMYNLKDNEGYNVGDEYDVRIVYKEPCGNTYRIYLITSDSVFDLPFEGSSIITFPEEGTYSGTIYLTEECKYIVFKCLQQPEELRFDDSISDITVIIPENASSASFRQLPREWKIINENNL